MAFRLFFSREFRPVMLTELVQKLSWCRRTSPLEGNQEEMIFPSIVSPVDNLWRYRILSDTIYPRNLFEGMLTIHCAEDCTKLQP